MGLAHIWCEQEGGAVVPGGATSHIRNASPEFPPQQTLWVVPLPNREKRNKGAGVLHEGQSKQS